MTDNNIANILLRMPRTSRVYVEPFSTREKVAGVMKSGIFGGLALAASLLLSAFVTPLPMLFTVGISVVVFLTTLAVITVNGYRDETVRTLQLCSGYTGCTLPKEANIVRAALRIPFRSQRIPLRSFEADLNQERSRGRGSFLIHHHHAKQVGTHVIENALMLKPGKVWFEQTATVTSFGIMLKDFEKDMKGFKTNP